MHPLSVVILTRNEETGIATCIESAKQVSDDIIIIDSGSNDNTLLISSLMGARCFSLDWQGFGFARNFGAAQARHDWIIALDADERISKKLAQQINKTGLADNCVYKFRRENYLGNVKMKFGAWGFDTVKRIYNRRYAKWNAAIVHEKIISDQRLKYKFLPGTIVHYGFKDFNAYKNKVIIYARLSAEKYFLQGRKSNFLKKICSPLFNSLKSYFLQFGFLDGWDGLRLAYMIGYYSWLKYFYLQEINSQASHEDFSETKMNVASNRSFF